MSKHLEEIIQYVKRHPQLYDVEHRDYKNTKIKDKLWNQLAAQLHEEGEAVKKKWKNLRDSYAKYLKSHTKAAANNDSVYRYKTWPWAKKMDAFKPYLKYSRKKESTNDIEYATNSPNNSDDEQPELETKYHEIVEVNIPETVIEMPTPEPASKRKRGNYSQERVISFLDTENDYCTINTNDPTELIFLGYAKSIRKFSPKRQSIIKLKIAKLIMEEELLQQMEDEPHQTISIVKPGSPNSPTSNSYNYESSNSNQ